jgi:hypothetical protein
LPNTTIYTNAIIHKRHGVPFSWLASKTKPDIPKTTNEHFLPVEEYKQDVDFVFTWDQKLDFRSDSMCDERPGVEPVLREQGGSHLFLSA